MWINRKIWLSVVYGLLRGISPFPLAIPYPLDITIKTIAETTKAVSTIVNFFSEIP